MLSQLFAKIINGLKTPVFSVSAFVFIYFLVIQSQTFWLKQHLIIEQLLPALLVLVIVFASYFNRSRLAFLSSLWLLYYASIAFNPPWTHWLATQGKWLTLFGCFSFLLFSMIKDRGVVSIHGFYRLVFLVIAGVSAYVWLWASEPILQLVQAMPNLVFIQNYVLVELPIIICLAITLWRAINQTNLVNSAVFISLCVWTLYQFQLMTLPVSITLALLACYYLLVVVIDAYFLAYRDDLTGLPSRRALNQLALSLGRKYTVAMLDIDHFKKFNDTYGHDIGDQVLKLVAAKIGNVKGGGKAFRYGGEEFTIVFPRKNIEQAIVELEAVRQAIQDYKIVIRHPQRKTKQDRSIKKGTKSNDFKTVSVTISIGVAIRSDKQHFEQALKCSDQALYKAKKKGRNNVSA